MHENDHQLPSRIQALASLWANVILTCGLLLVLYTTLFPFEFLWEEGEGLKDKTNTVELGIVMPDVLIDIPKNVLLFLPIGFGIAVLLKKRGRSNRTMLVSVLVCGFFLTLFVEGFQLFLPGRQTSLADILSNIAGALLGYLLFYLWGTQILNFATVSLRKISPYLNARILTAVIAVYASVAILLSFRILGGATLDNWDDSFPLILGNEHTGDRPWQGQIAELLIADRALSEDSIALILSTKDQLSNESSWLAYYKLTGEADYSDKTGNLPDLSWRGAGPEDKQAVNDQLTRSRWLETEAPVTPLIQRLRQTSQFTLVTRIATADLDQTGPARIVSISGDPYQRNFTLGQEGRDLVLRLRTPVTGINGIDPEMAIPEFFTGTGWHHIVVTYSDSVMRLYVDTAQQVYTFQLSPEVTNWRLLPPIKSWILLPHDSPLNVFTILYHGLIIFPLTFLLGLIAARLKWPITKAIVLIGSGLLLFTLMLEGSSIVDGKLTVRPQVIILDLTIATMTYIFFKVRAVPWLQQFSRQPSSPSPHAK